MRLRQSLGAWALLAAGVLAGCPGQGTFTFASDGPAGEVHCADGADDDADGQADCLDPDCDQLGPCEYGQERSCNDGLDNDGDGLTDRDDADCPADQPVCGDAACNGGENCSTCADDCGSCPPDCGNGSCDADETCANCPEDCEACPPACGDGSCEGPENCATCEADCGPCPISCGNATCEADESCVSCEADCGACPTCGDGSCDPEEACTTCPSDCGACPSQCGDLVCGSEEGCASCPADCPCTAPGILLPPGSTWRYLDDGSDQGTAWTAPVFDDGAWASGPAQLGYGDGDEATVVGYGPNASAKYPATYFRSTFEVADPTAYHALTLRLLRDDGAVVYVNGAEAARSNMPTGTIGYRTFAASTASCESCWYDFVLAPALLVKGRNVVAVQVHQSGGSSSDISLDLELRGRSVADAACGNGTCDPAESCESCPADCGVCPPRCGDARCAASETCTTCPGDCGECGAPWSFFVLGDSRSNPSIFRDNLTSMYLMDPSAVLAINVGDLTAQGLVSEWNTHQSALATAAPDPTVPADPTGVVRQSRFRTDVTDFGPYIRYLGVIGNHDLGNTDWYANWNKYLPGQAGLGVNATSGIYFSFMVRDALFIILDSQHPSSAQTAWLQSLLESPEGQSAKWKFAYFHRPIYPCNGKSPFSGGLPWASLFEAHDVKLAWVADSHTYERTCAMRGGTCAADGVIYLNTSGAGAEVRSVNATRTATVTYGSRSDTYRCADILARHREYWHHFCHVQMTDCQSTIRCYGHQYHTTREAPFDTLVIDRCN